MQFNQALWACPAHQRQALFLLFASLLSQWVTTTGNKWRLFREHNDALSVRGVRTGSQQPLDNQLTLCQLRYR